MQVNQLDLCEDLGIRPCCYRNTDGFVDTAADRTIHCSSIADGANLYQCDKTSRTLSETFGGKIGFEFGVPSASMEIGHFFTGCTDKPVKLRAALDETTWKNWNKPEVQFQHDGETWTLKRVRVTGGKFHQNFFSVFSTNNL